MLTNPTNELAQARGAAARTHLLSVASRPVWNIVGGAINAVEGHLYGPPLSFWWDDEDEDETPACGYTITEEGVAVIPIQGTLVDSEPSWWMSYLGYCSIPQIARAVTAAGADGNVKDILLDVDSPGGHVSGLAAACDAVWAIRQAGEKHIWAACKMVASAAYEIASQCERMYLTPDGMGGCIGTLYLLSDWSGYYSQMGVVMLRVASDGAETYKGAGARGTKITPAMEANYKRMCNEYRVLFNGIIQRGRGFSDETMLALADGRIHIGANALQLSLVDGIATPDAVLSALGGGDDLDDLAGPPSQSPPDPDSDEEASDKDSSDPRSPLVPITLQENFPLNNPNRNGTTSRNDAQNQNQAPGWFTSFMASLAGDAPKTEDAKNQEAKNAEPHPVLTAALAAGLDTPEKLKSVLDERTARQEAEEKQAAQALTDARTAAQSAAVTAFGQGTPQLTAAQEAIAEQQSLGALSAMTNAYKAVRPAPLKPGAPRQTSVAATQSDDDGSGKLDDQTATTVQQNLTPSNVYAKRRNRK